MGNLYISHDAADLAVDCCPDHIGAVLFTDSETALKNSGGNYTEQPYLLASQNDYIIHLTEPAQRKRYFFVNLDEAQFTLSETPVGRWYELEIWYTTTLSTWDRQIDTLREMRRVIWNGSDLVDARIGVDQVGEMSQWIAHAAVSYDHITQTVYFACWLEKDGLWITDPKKVNVVWNDSVGVEILSREVTQFSYTTGIFQFNAAGIDLTADRVSPVQVAITAADDSVYTSTATVVTWD